MFEIRVSYSTSMQVYKCTVSGNSVSQGPLLKLTNTLECVWEPASDYGSNKLIKQTQHMIKFMTIIK